MAGCILHGRQKVDKGYAVTLLPTFYSPQALGPWDDNIHIWGGFLPLLILTGMLKCVLNLHLGAYKLNQVDSEEDPSQCISLWQAVL